MAGHSKWANIRFRKGAQDAKRAKIYTKLIREIFIATRQGGPDPASNPRLRLAIDKAKSESMPKDNIDRAIKRGSGESDGEHYDEVRYEGYGPSGIAVMVDCLTDNRNRTAADVRHAFSKHGGNLGEDGSVSYLFTHVGLLSYPADVDEDALMESAIEAGARDVVENDDGSFDVITDPGQYEYVKQTMIAAGHEPEHAELTMRPAAKTEIDAGCLDSFMKMIDTLDDLDDVQQVYSNAEIPDELLQEQA